MKAGKGGGGGTEKAPAGNHLAVLVGFFDMGHQWQDPFTPKDKGYWAHRAFFVWELVGEKIAGTEKKHVIGIDLTLSLNEKAKLRKWIEARTGKQIPDGSDYDIGGELGQPCLLNVILKGDFPKVEGVAAVPAVFLKSMPTPGYKPTLVTLDQFMKKEATIPEWCPWLFGCRLEDHISACKEIGAEKPKPKKRDDSQGGNVSPNGIATGTNDVIPF